MSREIVRNCHEKLLENSMSGWCFFGFLFFFWWRKTVEDWVSQRSQSEECKCEIWLWQEFFNFDELYGAMFWLQKYKITTPCHSFVWKWSRNIFLLKLETGIETYYIIWSHVSTSSHIINTFQRTLFETQMIIFQNHILKGEKASVKIIKHETSH